MKIRVVDDTSNHIRHLAVVCVINLVAQRFPAFCGHSERGEVVGFVRVVLVSVVLRSMVPLHHHRYRAKQCAHGSTPQPDVHMVLQVRHVVPCVPGMASKRIEKRTLVFLQSLTRQTIITARLKQSTILLVPFLVADVCHSSRQLTKTYFLQAFLYNATYTRNEFTEHLRAILACLLTLSLSKCREKSHSVLHLIITLVVHTDLSRSKCSHCGGCSTYTCCIADICTCRMSTQQYTCRFQRSAQHIVLP